MGFPPYLWHFIRAQASYSAKPQSKWSTACKPVPQPASATSLPPSLSLPPGRSSLCSFSSSSFSSQRPGLPNGIIRSVTLPCSYRRCDISRNGAPTFSQANQPSVIIFLDRSGSNPFWAIHVDGRLVYHMLPNPADYEYNSFPNIQGAWVAWLEDAKLGEWHAQFLSVANHAIFRSGVYVSVPVMAQAHEDAAASGDVGVPMNTLALVGHAASV